MLEVSKESGGRQEGTGRSGLIGRPISTRLDLTSRRPPVTRSMVVPRVAVAASVTAASGRFAPRHGSAEDGTSDDQHQRPNDPLPCEHGLPPV